MKIKVAGSIILFGLFLSACSLKEEVMLEEAKITMEEESSIGIVGEEAQEEILSVEEENIIKTEEEKEIYVYVHLCGEVMKPGVYYMSSKSRLYEVLEAAGGYTKEANIDAINLAQAITDGMQVEIPSMHQTTELEVKDDGKVNINEASEGILCTIPGIGITKAKNIISFRETLGKFKEIEDIMKVEGIKEATFEKLKEYIKTEE